MFGVKEAVDQKKKVLIVDIDLHFGNGTKQLIRDRE